MCGIVGVASRDGFNPRALLSGVDGVRHRGPDGSGTFLSKSGRVGLGHTRLAIIDLSESGHQPMTSGDGRFTITFNGEIYNYLELKTELRANGATFRGDSDTEVLLEGYARFGKPFLHKANGIFAFAIHDAVDDSVYLARDHSGIKPLYYSASDEGVTFASELKALLAIDGQDHTIDISALRRYLTFLWCPGEQTAFSRVKKLGPATGMTVLGGRVVDVSSYWERPTYAPRRNWSVQDCASELRAVIDRSVSRQMVADVPVGAFLSGGLDSSAVVAAARLQTPDIACFTIDTDHEEGTINDLPFARGVATALGVKLHEVRVDPRLMCERLIDMPRVLDEPLADPACLNVQFIAELARSAGVKVLLSGAGGDDLFTGYRRHTALKFDDFWNYVPRSWREAMAGVSGNVSGHSATLRRIKKVLATSALPPQQRISSAFAWGPLGLADGLFSEDLRREFDSENVFEPLQAVLNGARELPTIEQCLELERRFFLADHNLIYTDKMSMAAGVETRVPLLDLEVIEFASTIPVEWKLKGMTPKWIFKQSQVGRLPSSTIFRPKAGFGAPLRKWLHQEMREVVEEVLSPASVQARGLFSHVAVSKLRHADQAGEIDGAYTILSLMCIELWCRAFVDAPMVGVTKRPAAWASA